MNKTHIIILVFIAAGVGILISKLPSNSTYETINTAIAKPGKFVHVMARLDKTQPVEYNALKDPNFLSFTAIDTLGNTVKVVYNHPKPENFEMSEKLVLQGKYVDGLFQCKTIQTKCPSKYKDDMKAVEKSINTSITNPADKGSEKYN